MVTDHDHLNNVDEWITTMMNNVDELLLNNTRDLPKAEACKIALHEQLQDIQKLDQQIVELVEEENIERKSLIAATLKQLYKKYSVVS